MPILEVKNIKKGFGDTDVLKGVSFSMERGQVPVSYTHLTLPTKA